jgi:non-ribosomal peptide synthase protein (TIGR01720 family)
MVPALLLELAALPLTPNGKLDRKALAALQPTSEQQPHDLVAPRSPVEEVLANIWAQVLQRDRVGIHDNFFQLGGDSILSIQVVARANQAGLRLTAKDMFDHQTIARLAAVVSSTTTVTADQSLVLGPVLLTPIQRWFWERQLPEPHHFNQSLLLRLRPPLHAPALHQALLHLLAHHDALRLRFYRQSQQWQQENSGWPPQRRLLARVDLSGLSQAHRAAALTAAANQTQASLQLDSGCLLQAVLLEGAAHQSPWLLLIIHHLAVDGVSWRILLQDLQTAYTRLAQGLTPQLPAKSTSFQHWAARLNELASSSALLEQLPYWLDPDRQHIPPLPLDGTAENDRPSIQLAEGWLNQEDTTAVLQQVPQSFAVQIQETLLTALAVTLSQWTASERVLVDLEGHGREDILPGVDVSRTIGWFTTWFPLLLRVNGPLETTLAQVQATWRQLPMRGIGYGLLRYLAPDASIANRLAALPQAQVSFNYLGQFDQVLSQDSFFTPASESSGQAQSSLGTRSHLLEINGMVIGGRLRMQWSYHPGIHHHETVQRLSTRFLDVLRQFITLSRSRPSLDSAADGIDSHALSIVAETLARAERA